MSLKSFLNLLADGIENTIEEAPANVTSSSSELAAAFGKMLLTFGILIFLLFATYWFVKRLVRLRLEKGTGAGTIAILEKKMLSPKTMLYVVQVEEKKVLIAESQLEIKQIATLD